MNNYFCFKQFAIAQDNASMKVGTDGVLLGAWCNCTDAQKVLDIGTGTGLLALMVAQRSAAQIAAVEIEELACLDAVNNIENSPWANRIELFNLSVQEFTETTTERFDFIISNPPFFSNSLKAPDAARTLARHNDSLPAAELFACCAQLLTNNGIVAIIIPTNLYDEYLAAAHNYNLYVTRRCMVKPTDQLPPHRIMVEFVFGTQDATNEQYLTIEQGGRHCYSPEYIELTREFYLKF